MIFIFSFPGSSEGFARLREKPFCLKVRVLRILISKLISGRDLASETWLGRGERPGEEAARRAVSLGGRAGRRSVAKAPKICIEAPETRGGPTCARAVLGRGCRRWFSPASSCWPQLEAPPHPQVACSCVRDEVPAVREAMTHGASVMATHGQSPRCPTCPSKSMRAGTRQSPMRTIR